MPVRVLVLKNFNKYLWVLLEYRVIYIVKAVEFRSDKDLRFIAVDFRTYCVNKFRVVDRVVGLYSPPVLFRLILTDKSIYDVHFLTAALHLHLPRCAVALVRRSLSRWKGCNIDGSRRDHSVKSS